MAWTGTATITKVADNLVRITGLSLAASAAGTIGLFGGSGDESLPDNFNPVPYDDIDLAEAIQAWYVPAATVANALLVSITKAASPFLVTFTNDDGVNATPALEIYLRYH